MRNSWYHITFVFVFFFPCWYFSLSIGSDWYFSFSDWKEMVSFIYDIKCVFFRGDVAVALFWALVFGFLVISSYVTFYFRHFRLSFVIICLGVLLPIRLRTYRQALAKKRERRLLLPLSMWSFRAVTLQL